jgi:hypothetical protein
METAVVLSVLVLLCVPIGFAFARALQIFRLEVEAGRVRRVRGRLSRVLLSEIEAVLGRSGVSGKVVVSRSRGTVVVTTSGGIDAGVQQQLRNVIGIVPLQRLLSAPAFKRG